MLTLTSTTERRREGRPSVVCEFWVGTGEGDRRVEGSGEGTSKDWVTRAGVGAIGG